MRQGSWVGDLSTSVLISMGSRWCCSSKCRMYVLLGSFILMYDVTGSGSGRVMQPTGRDVPVR